MSVETLQWLPFACLLGKKVQEGLLNTSVQQVLGVGRMQSWLLVGGLDGRRCCLVQFQGPRLAFDSLKIAERVDLGKLQTARPNPFHSLVPHLAREWRQPRQKFAGEKPVYRLSLSLSVKMPPNCLHIISHHPIRLSQRCAGRLVQVRSRVAPRQRLCELELTVDRVLHLRQRVCTCLVRFGNDCVL